MIDTTFTLTEAEFIAAQKLYQRDAMKKTVRQRWNVTALALLSVLGAALLQRNASHFLLIPLTLAAYGPATMLFGVISATLNKSHFSDAYKRNIAAVSNLHLTLDDTGYRFQILDLTNGFVSWPVFTSWMEDSSVFLLGRGSLFYPVPKSALNAIEIDELRSLCVTHIKSPASGV